MLKRVYDWLRTKEKRQITLKLLNRVGEIIETWRYEDASIMEVDFGKLDYSASDPMEIHLVLGYSNVVLE